MGESQKSLHLLVQLERQQCPSTIESSEKERSMDRGEDRGDGHLSVGLSLTRWEGLTVVVSHGGSDTERGF